MSSIDSRMFFPCEFYAVIVMYNCFYRMQVATYCDMYPVTNYTMEIKRLSSESDMQSQIFRSTTNHIIANDLLENKIYKFQMRAWNSAGSVSSDAVTVCKLATEHFQL